MRQIEYRAAKAIAAKQNFKERNTRVVYDPKTDYSKVYLYDSPIALFSHRMNDIILVDSGHYTKTTKSRMNSLLLYFRKKAYVFQHQFEWFIQRNGKVSKFRKYNIVME